LTGAQFAKAYNQLRNQNYYKNPDSLGVGTDWQEEILRTAPMSNFQFGANGGNETVTYNFSANYFNQDGIIKNTSYDRGTFRLNLDMKLKPWFTLGNNVSYSVIKEQLGPNVITSAYRIPSVLPVYNSDGIFTDPTFFGLALGNPLVDQFYKSNRYKNGSNLLGNMFGEISILKNLKFRSNFGYNFSDSKTRGFEPKFEASPSQLNKNDRLSIETGSTKNWIWEQTLNFLKE